MEAHAIDPKRYPLLARIDGPADLKRLARAELKQLAEEIRAFLLEALAPIGGHLGANLGVVELTIALHYVFDSPREPIIWDVGHQSYVHKILTGRKEGIYTIRQTGGLSGFTKRDESPHDVFGAGHACTSISAALGFACARDLMGGAHQVVAVIGDGALGGGMALEALNHAGHLQKKLLVVLNDNEMSISPNVGAIANYLARIITGGPYARMREKAKEILARIPGALEAAHKLEAHAKGVLTPGGLFEELGFRYIGPIDGHDLDALIPTLENCRRLPGPVLLHVLTRKGKGFAPAEDSPEVWHGIGPFDPTTGKPLAKKDARPTWTNIFGDALVELAEHDPRIVAITAAMSAGTGLSRFAKRFPERFFDVGIAEQHAVTFAAGLAAAGMRPVCAIYSTFLQRAYDQIIHDVALQRLPVVFCLDRAGIVGADGATHAGIFDLAYLRCVPNMVVMAPSSAAELAAMLAFALGQDGPCAIRYPRGEADPPMPDEAEAEPMQLGKARLVRKGEEGVLVAVGHTLARAQEALEAVGCDFALVDLRFVKPLDVALLAELAGASRPVVVVEEGVAAGGVGEAIAAALVARGWRGRFVPVGVPDRFPPHGAPEDVRAALGLSAEAIAKRLQEAAA